MPQSCSHSQEGSVDMKLMDVQNGSYTQYVLTETADELNLRYANTLLPLATILGVFCVLE